MIDKQADQIRKLKKMLKVYAKRMKDGEGMIILILEAKSINIQGEG